MKRQVLLVLALVGTIFVLVIYLLAPRPPAPQESPGSSTSPVTAVPTPAPVPAATAGINLPAAPAPAPALLPEPAAQPPFIQPVLLPEPALPPQKSEHLAILVQQAKTAIAAERPELVQPLEDLLLKDPEKRIDAIQTLGFADEPRVLRPILNLLAEDAVPEVRAAAAASLDVHEAIPEASMALVQALGDAEENVRGDALLSLKAHRNSLVQRELQQSLKAGKLAPDTAEEVNLFLSKYYVPIDPFKSPLGE